jgi:hypothetical protein
MVVANCQGRRAWFVDLTLKWNIFVVTNNGVVSEGDKTSGVCVGTPGWMMFRIVPLLQ